MLAALRKAAPAKIPLRLYIGKWHGVMVQWLDCQTCNKEAYQLSQDHKFDLQNSAYLVCNL